MVREAQTHCEVIEAASRYAVENGFSVLGLDYSPIKGPEGNIEFLMYVEKNSAPIGLSVEQINMVVERAHQSL